MTSDLDRRRLDAAQLVCTPAELEMFALVLAGYSERRAAATLHISRSSVRDRLRNARRKIERHLEQESAS